MRLELTSFAYSATKLNTPGAESMSPGFCMSAYEARLTIASPLRWNDEEEACHGLVSRLIAPQEAEG